MSVDDDLAQAEKYADGDLLAILYRQHADITEALNRVSDSKSDERSANFTAVTAFMKKHESAEQQVVRPVIEETDRGEEADARNAEEQQADQTIAVLSALDMDSFEFDAQFAQLKAAVAAHAEAEETNEFPVIEISRSVEQRAELGRQFLLAQAE